MSPKRSLFWVGVWVSLALLVTAGIFKWYGRDHGLEFLTCYLIEWTLSVDNLFVFLMIFRTFGVDSHHQLRALEWGIAGAIVFRLTFILLGLALVRLFEPVLYIFGAILIWSGVKMALQKEKAVNVQENALVKWLTRRFRFTDNFVGDRFFIRQNGVLFATPMVMVVGAIESADIMFAVDSIPAAFAITRNPWIIFFANIFAILGLRSLYFLLAHADQRFALLRYGVAIILTFVGVKMMIHDLVKFPSSLSLGFVLLILASSVILSLLIKSGESIKRETSL